MFGKNFRILLFFNLTLCILAQIFSLGREFLYTYIKNLFLSNIFNEISLTFSLMVTLSNVTICVERIYSYLFRKNYEKHENKKITKLVVICIVFIILEAPLAKILVIKKFLSSLFNMTSHLFLQFTFLIVGF